MTRSEAVPGTTRLDGVNVARDLWNVAGERPAAPALWFGGGEESWSYARLVEQAAVVATWLRRHRVEPGDRVVLVMGNWPEHVAAWYGILAAGAIVVDVNFIVQDEEWGFILDDCDPAAIVGGAPFRSRLESLANGVPMLWASEPGAGFGDRGEHQTHDLCRVEDDAGVAVIAYTSGTTGLPKGVMHTHASIDRQLRLLADVQGYRPDDVVYQAIPLFALQGYLPMVASAVRAGAAVVLTDRFDPVDLSQASRRFGITYLTLAAPMLDAIMRLPDDEMPVFPALRLLTAGGAPLQPEVRSRFEALVGVPVSQGYGMTEVLGVLVADYEGDAPWGSCGRIRPEGSRDIVVLDESGRTAGPGEVGELAVHRSCVMTGYWRRPELLDQQLSGDWFRTGDIGKIDDAGFFYVLDRKKDMIIRGGFNIYSAEIERVLSEHPAVAEATVIGAPDERLGEVPVAFIVPRDTVDVESLSAELTQTTKERLGSLKTPEWIAVVDADDLPRNALRKVRKRELRDSLRSSP